MIYFPDSPILIFTSATYHTHNTTLNSFSKMKKLLFHFFHLHRSFSLSLSLCASPIHVRTHTQFAPYEIPTTLSLILCRDFVLPSLSSSSSTLLLLLRSPPLLFLFMYTIHKHSTTDWLESTIYVFDGYVYIEIIITHRSTLSLLNTTIEVCYATLVDWFYTPKNKRKTTKI